MTSAREAELVELMGTALESMNAREIKTSMRVNPDSQSPPPPSSGVTRKNSLGKETLGTFSRTI